MIGFPPNFSCIYIYILYKCSRVDYLNPSVMCEGNGKVEPYVGRNFQR